MASLGEGPFVGRQPAGTDNDADDVPYSSVGHQAKLAPPWGADGGLSG